MHTRKNQRPEDHHKKHGNLGALALSANQSNDTQRSVDSKFSNRGAGRNTMVACDDSISATVQRLAQTLRGGGLHALDNHFKHEDSKR